MGSAASRFFRATLGNGSRDPLHPPLLPRARTLSPLRVNPARQQCSGSSVETRRPRPKELPLRWRRGSGHNLAVLYTLVASCEKHAVKPFFEFDILAFSERDAETLEGFTKTKFDATTVRNRAEDIIYTGKVTDYVNEL